MGQASNQMRRMETRTRQTESRTPWSLDSEPGNKPLEYRTEYITEHKGFITPNTNGLDTAAWEHHINEASKGMTLY